MQAIWNNKVIAEADKEDLIYIEGNWYFPPDALKKEYFKPSNKHTTCFWKGQASYYQIVVDDVVNDDGAWYYPEPMPSSFKIVSKDYTNYIAFWHGVKVSEQDNEERIKNEGIRSRGLGQWRGWLPRSHANG